MNNWYTFFLGFWLLFGYRPVAILANTATQRPTSTATKEQAKTKPAARTPEDPTKKKFKIPTRSLTEAQKEEKTRRLTIEEMAMQRAWMYSAFLPGLGQAYNKQYWRVPVIYGVLIGLGWGAIYNHNAYIEAKHEFLAQQGSSSRILSNHVDSCRRDRDLCVIFAALWYIANIFDAYVGASLKTFDLSNDIGLKVQPSIAPPSTHHSPSLGLSLAISLKQ